MRSPVESLPHSPWEMAQPARAATRLAGFPSIRAFVTRGTKQALVVSKHVAQRRLEAGPRGGNHPSLWAERPPSRRPAGATVGEGACLCHLLDVLLLDRQAALRLQAKGLQGITRLSF